MPRQNPSYQCPRCGAAIHVGQRTCSNCALGLDPASLSAYANQRQQPKIVRPFWRSPPGLIIGAFLALILMCSCGGIFSAVSHPVASNAATPTAVIARVDKPAQSFKLPATATMAILQPTATSSGPAPLTATAAPSLGFGDTAQTSAWTISLGRIEQRPRLDIPSGQALKPTGRWWVVWLDARNNSDAARSLASDFTAQLRGATGAPYAELDQSDTASAAAFAQQEGRDPLTTNVAANALVHPVLVFDATSDDQISGLVIKPLDDSTSPISYNLAEESQAAGFTAATVAANEQQASATAAAINAHALATAETKNHQATVVAANATLTSQARRAATATPTPEEQAQPVGQYTASATVSNASPTKNTHVTITGRLLKNGKPVPGVVMNTTWYYKTTVSACSGNTGPDGRASCERSISRATAGYTVEVDVDFVDGAGNVLASTNTDFTPR